MKQQPIDSEVPTKYGHVHEFKMDNYYVLFNAKANMYSMAILNKKEHKFFKAVDGNKNLIQLFSKAKSHKTFEQLSTTYDYLKQKNIIHCLPDEPVVDVSPSKAGSIWLHVSNQCNLRCTYCYIKKTNEHLDPDRGKVYAENAFKVLQQQGMESVNVKLAGGEPTLRFEQTMDFADYLRELGPKYGLDVDITLLTNGTLINSARAKQLREKKN